MVTPTPTMPGAGARELEYRGRALAQLRILKQQMALGGLTTATRTADLGEGVSCYCKVCFKQEEVYVFATPLKPALVHFVAHPQTDSSPAGVFPLVDDDHGTYAINLDGKALKTLQENYGNAYHAGVSWRAPSGLFLENKTDAAIPGLTHELDTWNPDSTADPIYTPLDKKLYFAGAAFKTAPPGYVLCAGVVDSVLHIVTQKMTGPYTTNHFIHKWEGGAWVEVRNREALSRLPCAFDSAGITFNNLGESGVWSHSGVWTEHAPDVGVLVQNAGGWSRTRHLNGTILLPGVTIDKHSTDVTGGVNSWTQTMGDITAYAQKSWQVVTDYCPEDCIASDGSSGDYRWTMIDSYETTGTTCANNPQAGCTVVSGTVVCTKVLSTGSAKYCTFAGGPSDSSMCNGQLVDGGMGILSGFGGTSDIPNTTTTCFTTSERVYHFVYSFLGGDGITYGHYNWSLIVPAQLLAQARVTTYIVEKFQC